MLRVRRRTEEGLRAYIESGAAEENRAVDRLIATLEQRGLALRDAEVPLNARTSLELATGTMRVVSPTSMKLRHPDHAFDTRDVQERTADGRLGDDILRALDTVHVRELAGRTRAVLVAHGPMTIAGVVERAPIEAGLEELVGLLRVARSVGAASLDRRETVSVGDRDGSRVSATLPALLLGAEMFPEAIDELTV